MRTIDPEEHGKITPFPYWLHMSGLTIGEERALLKRIADTMGAGGRFPDINQQWVINMMAGYAVLMFRNEEDRTLVQVLIS